MTDKYKQAFQEEAREIVVELELALLALNETPEDMEIVGRVFRAMHTIKGSGAMFGFDQLAGFTHNLENAFDEVRNGRLKVTGELINLSLGALDQIKGMLEETSGPGADTERILADLRRLTGKVETVPAAAAPAVLDTAAVAESAMRDWVVRFYPGADLMRTGADPLLLLRELRLMGSLRIKASMVAVPPLGELDPERCYIGWDMVLTTAAARQAISDVFIFVEDICELTIEPIAGESGTAVEQYADSCRGGAATDSADSAMPAAAAEVARNGGEQTVGRRQQNSAASAPPNRRETADATPSPTASAAASIRVPAARLDQFVDLVGELVTVQARLGELAMRREDPDVVAVAEEIERLTSALRESSMNIRMLPMRSTFEKFRRLVHDLARDLHKEVELTIEGADTELDKTVIDQLSDPLMHLIRNSMDHGIEAPEGRAAAGKRGTARLHLSAKHSGASVLIGIADDGRGINAKAVRERAIEKGLVAADAQLTEAEIFSLILTPGFSTAKTITDVSGRGVGMDVVRRSVEALRGTIDITSKPGAGTTVTLKLPLTLAIIDGLLVRIGEAYFVLPLATTLECIELTRQDIEKANGKHMAYVRGEVIPYIRLREYFDIQTKRPEIEQIMVAETEGGRYGFVVDQVLGDHQTVIKNLGRLYRHVSIVSGATILGNGSVALILDPQRLVQEAVRNKPATRHAQNREVRGRAQAMGAQ
jgi:two-component system chemotaxis sensor kinase CheA